MHALRTTSSDGNTAHIRTRRKTNDASSQRTCMLWHVNYYDKYDAVLINCAETLYVMPSCIPPPLMCYETLFLQLMLLFSAARGPVLSQLLQTQVWDKLWMAISYWVIFICARRVRILWICLVVNNLPQTLIKCDIIYQHTDLCSVLLIVVLNVVLIVVLIGALPKTQ